MMQRITVAEMPIDIEMSDNAFMQARLLPYASAAEGPAQMRLVSHTVEEIVPPAGELVRTIHNTQIIRLPDGKLCHCQYSQQEQRFFQMSVYTADFSDVEIFVAPPKDSVLRGIDYEYAYTGFDFANRFGYLGGAVLHGSAIAYKGEGVVFSAPSGTGKSTHTALWKRCFGEDVVFVNDDKPPVRVEDDTVWMYGAPWSGKSDLNSNVRVPLKAIVFIERAAENSIRRLDLTESIFRIRCELVQPYHDEKIGEKLVDVMIDLAQRVPVYLLSCNMEPEAAEVSRRAVFGE